MRTSLGLWPLGLLALVGCPSTQQSIECVADTDCRGGARCIGGSCEVSGAPDLSATTDMAPPPPDLYVPVALAPAWSRRFGSPMDESGGALAPLPSGDVLLGAAAGGPFDLDTRQITNPGLVLARFDINSAAAKFVYPITQIQVHRPASGRPLNQIAIDSNGDVIVAGTYLYMADCGNGTEWRPGGTPTLFVTKFNGQTGACLWSKSFGTRLLEQLGYGMAVNSARDIYLAGSFLNQIDFNGTTYNSIGGVDIFLAQLSTDGFVKTVKRYGSSATDAATALAIDSKDNVLLAGHFSKGATVGDILANRGGLDGFVAKLSKDLSAVQWTYTFGGPQDDVVTGMALNDDGAIAVSGTYLQSLDLDPLAPGSNTLTSLGGTDGFVLTLTPAGKIGWGKSLGGARNDEARALALDRFGDVYVTGVYNERVRLGDRDLTSQGQDFFVARYGDGGTFKWADGYGGAGTEQVWALALTPLGSVYITGSTTSDPLRIGDKALAGAGGEDAFLLKLVPANDIVR